MNTNATHSVSPRSPAITPRAMYVVLLDEEEEELFGGGSPVFVLPVGLLGGPAVDPVPGFALVDVAGSSPPPLAGVVFGSLFSAGVVAYPLEPQ